MAFEFNDLKGFLFLVLFTVPITSSTNYDCRGKSFHCLNSTHFMICVDLGGGVSTTIDDFIIPCPPTTECHQSNRFECEFPKIVPVPSIYAVDVSEGKDNSDAPPLNTVKVSSVEMTTAIPPTESDNVFNALNTELIEKLNPNETFFEPAVTISTNFISSKHGVDTINEIGTTAANFFNENETDLVTSTSNPIDFTTLAEGLFTHFKDTTNIPKVLNSSHYTNYTENVTNTEELIEMNMKEQNITLNEFTTPKNLIVYKALDEMSTNPSQQFGTIENYDLDKPPDTNISFSKQTLPSTLQNFTKDTATEVSKALINVTDNVSEWIYDNNHKEDFVKFINTTKFTNYVFEPNIQIPNKTVEQNDILSNQPRLAEMSNATAPIEISNLSSTHLKDFKLKEINDTDTLVEVLYNSNYNSTSLADHGVDSTGFSYVTETPVAREPISDYSISSERTSHNIETIKDPNERFLTTVFGNGIKIMDTQGEPEINTTNKTNINFHSSETFNITMHKNNTHGQLMQNKILTEKLELFINNTTYNKVDTTLPNVEPTANIVYDLIEQNQNGQDNETYTYHTTVSNKEHTIEVASDGHKNIDVKSNVSVINTDDMLLTPTNDNMISNIITMVQGTNNTLQNNIVTIPVVKTSDNKANNITETYTKEVPIGIKVKATTNLPIEDTSSKNINFIFQGIQDITPLLGFEVTTDNSNINNRKVPTEEQQSNMTVNDLEDKIAFVPNTTIPQNKTYVIQHTTFPNIEHTSNIVYDLTGQNQNGQDNKIYTYQTTLTTEVASDNRQNIDVSTEATVNNVLPTPIDTTNISDISIRVQGTRGTSQFNIGTIPVVNTSDNKFNSTIIHSYNNTTENTTEIPIAIKVTTTNLPLENTMSKNINLILQVKQDVMPSSGFEVTNNTYINHRKVPTEDIQSNITVNDEENKMAFATTSQNKPHAIESEYVQNPIFVAVENTSNYKTGIHGNISDSGSWNSSSLNSNTTITEAENESKTLSNNNSNWTATYSILSNDDNVTGSQNTNANVTTTTENLNWTQIENAAPVFNSIVNTTKHKIKQVANFHNEENILHTMTTGIFTAEEPRMSENTGDAANTQSLSKLGSLNPLRSNVELTEINLFKTYQKDTTNISDAKETTVTKYNRTLKSHSNLVTINNGVSAITNTSTAKVTSDVYEKHSAAVNDSTLKLVIFSSGIMKNETLEMEETQSYNSKLSILPVTDYTPEQKTNVVKHETPPVIITSMDEYNDKKLWKVQKDNSIATHNPENIFSNFSVKKKIDQDLLVERISLSNHTTNKIPILGDIILSEIISTGGTANVTINSNKFKDSDTYLNITNKETFQTSDQNVIFASKSEGINLAITNDSLIKTFTSNAKNENGTNRDKDESIKTYNKNALHTEVTTNNNKINSAVVISEGNWNNQVYTPAQPTKSISIFVADKEGFKVDNKSDMSKINTEMTKIYSYLTEYQNTFNDSYVQHIKLYNATNTTASQKNNISVSDKQTIESNIKSKAIFVTKVSGEEGNKNNKGNGNISTSSFDCHNMIRGKYADSKDCRKFYTCIGKLRPLVGVCPNNTVFSEINKQCTRNLSHCVRNNQFHCLYEGRFSDFFKDNIYYICVKNNLNGFLRYKLQCQDGYYLNKAIVKCEKTISISNDSLSSVSENSNMYNDHGTIFKSDEKEKSGNNDFECEKEGKFPHSSNCRKYYVCSKNSKDDYRRKIKTCSSDEVYDKEKKKCVSADSNEC